MAESVTPAGAAGAAARVAEHRLISDRRQRNSAGCRNGAPIQAGTSRDGRDAAGGGCRKRDCIPIREARCLESNRLPDRERDRRVRDAIVDRAANPRIDRQGIGALVRDCNAHRQNDRRQHDAGARGNGTDLLERIASAGELERGSLVGARGSQAGIDRAAGMAAGCCWHGMAL